MSTPGTAIARPSRTIIQTTVPRAAPSARRTPISRTRAVTEYASSPYTPMQASRIVMPAANVADHADDFNVTTLRSGDPNLPAHRVACREQCATQGHRDQRNGGLLQAVIPRDVT